MGKLGSGSTRARLLCAVGLTCLADAAAGQTQTPTEQPLPATQAAQSPDVGTAEEVVVTGIRASLQSAAAVKRTSVNVVDAVSAEEAGKFPDNNIAESLQRITGVAIDRTGGEGQFITVRGLGPQFNTVLVNGRVMATDNPGREFSFDVLSSNMIRQVIVNKTPTPQLQEGGIGSTVNIITARPLEGRAGFNATVSVGGIYDTQREQASPDISGVVSWTNPERSFGATLAAAYDDRKSQRDFAAIAGWILGAQGLINGTETSRNLTRAALTTSPADIHTPRNLTFNREFQKRERFNAAGAIQAELGERIMLRVDGIYSSFDVDVSRRNFGQFYTPRFLDLQVNEDRTVDSFSRPGLDFLTANPALAGGPQVTQQQTDFPITLDSRQTESFQVGANLRWNLTDRLEVSFDASRTEATRFNPVLFTVIGQLAQSSPRFDLNPEQDLPTASNFGTVTDPRLIRAHVVTNNEFRSEDAGDEFHIDTKWRAGDESILSEIAIGGQYLRRRKINSVANNQDGGRNNAYAGYAVAVPPDLLRLYDFSDFLPKASGSENVPTAFLTVDPYQLLAYLSRPEVLAIPRQGRTAQQQLAVANQLLSTPGGPFAAINRPGSRLDVEEKIWAGYIDVALGGENWGINAGVRVVDTSLVSRGFQQTIQSITNVVGDDSLTFVFNPAEDISVENDYTNILPSINARYNFTDRLLARVAYSKTVTRPTLTALGTNNNYQGRITAALSSGGNPLLLPFKSNNYDASLEWYISSVSFLGVAGFYKDFQDFLETQTLPVDLFGYTFQDTRTRNGQTGSILGVEVSGQYSFDTLPGFLSGFGVSGNYTYVSSKVDRGDGQASNLGCGYPGLSPHSANGSVFYEKYGLSARASYNWRSSFLRACFGEQGRPESRADYGQLDFSVAYDVTEQLQFYVQGVNVTNAYIHDYSVLEERLRLLENTGSRYLFGARLRF